MSNQRPGMFMPALIGGAVAGVLSGIPFINCLCCLWIIGGAMLSAYLLSKNSPAVLTAGDGAIVGILCGIIAAVVDFIISIPFQAMTSRFFLDLLERASEYTESLPEGWENLLKLSAAWSLLGLLFSVVIFSALGALGGIIGISIFKKKGSPQEISHVSQDTGYRQP